jgi:very-short-patch-repair endonuclease
MVSEKTRALRRGLLLCDKKRVLCDDDDCDACFNKSFASCIPKNIEIVDTQIDARDIQKYSQKELLFKCTDCNHTFIKKIMGFTTGEYCIYCTSKPIKMCDKEDCNFCFEKSFASHEKSDYWDYNKNKVSPRQVYKNSIERYFFNCNVCNHSFETAPNSINKLNCFCSYCANLKMCATLECNTCFYKSFAIHPFANSWSAKNKLLPWQVFRSSTSQKYFFDCKKCGHELYMVLGSIDENTLNCIYCASKKLCDDESCTHCFNKSFASNSFSQYWSLKNDVKPRDVFNKAHVKYIFDCRECKHEFKIDVSHIKEDKLNCVYCASLKMCDDKNCVPCFNKSFASHEKSQYWSPNNKVNPRDVFRCTEVKYIFNCNTCKNEFSSSPAYITSGTWCNKCVNKTEKKLYDWLINKYGEENIKSQFVMFNKEKKYLFDFYLPVLNLIIELDGLQHFKQVGKWKSPEHALENDINKINLSIENNLSIIHILQEDVYYNRNNWENKLSTCIKRYDVPTCIFIDNDEIYKTHKANINNKIYTIVV